MQVTIHDAKTQLSRLIAAAERGEEVIIARGSRPVARLVALPQGGFRLGTMKAEVAAAPDFLAPMEPADLDAWEGR